MRIEDELKTDKFQSEVHKAHLNILFTASVIRSRINHSLRPFGISSEQLNVLRIVRGQGQTGLRVKDINSRMLDRSSNTTRIIDRLEKKNYLARRRNEDGDARERNVIITPQGLELLGQIDRYWLDHNPHQSKTTDEEAQKLNDILNKLRERD